MKTLSPDQIQREKRIVVAIAVLFALTLVALGVWSIINGFHTGHTKQGISVTVNGAAARWMGAFEACLGMLMLSLAMPSKKAALRWLTFWVTCSGASLLFIFAR